MPTLGQVLRERTQAFTGSISSHRILLYTLFSFFAVVAAVANALRNYSNFYSVAIYLSKSSRSVLILANFSFLVALLAAHVVQKIFFGALRPSEIERLYDRLWFFITESLLAFTIFRDEFDTTFVVMFGFLLFVKSFHWIAGDRIEWMDQRPYPGPSLVFHVRMTALFSVLWVTDLLLFMIAVDSTLANGISGMVLFASEYGILMATVANTVAKYLLCTYELRRAGQRGGENAPPWENKSMWVFYIELATDFLKLTTYLIFFIIIMTFYGIPLNILRDVYVTGRSLITRLRSLQRYQTATRNMDERYPNATEAEMAAMSDHTCIICREEMVLPRPPEDPAVPPTPTDGPNTTPKKLPCAVETFSKKRRGLLRSRNSQESPLRPRTPPEIRTPSPIIPWAWLGAYLLRLGNRDSRHNRRLANHRMAPKITQTALGNRLSLSTTFSTLSLLANKANHRSNPRPSFKASQVQVVSGNHGLVLVPTTLSTLARPRKLIFPPAGEAQPEAPVPPTPTTEPSAGSSAREAAALAALRRLNGGRPTDSPTPTAASSTPAASPPTESAPQASASGSRPTSSAAPNRRVDVPQLIPMYDYTTPFGPNPNIPSPFSPQARPTMPGSRTSSQTLPPSTHSGNLRARLSARGPPPDSRYQQRPPLSQLPPTLTDEQLALMDSVTREAIDERLRVLEGVSGAVYRCIDELMRMRSALPIPTPASGPVAGSSTSVSPAPVASTSTFRASYRRYQSNTYPR
ncbi:RING-type domain-containing protein [Mycena sanguinolenta]|uniref:RING-type domain-containing protein n=1 Tax=Mycena sanguinolenta TaxID=230812 RepID=A0A8H6ZBG0_9AGAR|nr:RING-type domain-containing protein [Mycena sanguinolenta]